MSKESTKDMERVGFLRRNMERAKNNPNRFSYWFETLRDALGERVVIPETEIISISEKVNLAFWDSIFDGLPPNENTAVLDFVKENIFPAIQKSGEVFVKTDGFSNKFDFEKAHLKNADSIEEISEKLISTYYDWMMVGDGVVSEFIVRDFIHTENNRPTIYNGMKLNTELRVFYDFDEEKLIGIVNYWHPNEMIPYFMGRGVDVKEFFESEYSEENQFEAFLKPIREKIESVSKEMKGMTSEELLNFGYSMQGREQTLREEVVAYLSSYKDMVEEFDKWKVKLKKMLPEIFESKEVSLNGRWSLDFMVISDEKISFIDAAKMENSALVQWIEEGK